MSLLRIVKKSAENSKLKSGFVDKMTMKNALFYLCILLFACDFIIGFLVGFLVG